MHAMLITSCQLFRSEVLMHLSGVDDPDKAVQTLARFTAIRTISDRLAQNHVPDTAPFLEAHAFLRKAFPKVSAPLRSSRWVKVLATGRQSACLPARACHLSIATMQRRLQS